MHRKSNTIKINLPGGVIAAGDLLQIIIGAEKARVENIQFGARQQLYVKVPVGNTDQLISDLDKVSIFYEVNKETYPNIVSSYVSENVFQNANWMSEGVYKDILDTFHYRPQLKINIADCDQGFVPFFTGNLNFIAANLNNYWFLYIRFPRTNIIYRWPVWIYSFDISRISKLIEEIIFSQRKYFYDQETINGGLLYQIVSDNENFIVQNITEDLRLPDFRLPYYEGFNHYSNKIWLGIYRRNELFSLQFIKDICLVSLQTKIGQLYVTPWKSLIIKDIEQQHRKLWDYVLGKYRINVRHASNELNWQIEDLCEEGLILKRYLVNLLDRDDVRTFGLLFAVKTRPKTGLFGSIIILKKNNTSRNKRASLDRYDILYSKDFNPNNKELILFRSDVEKENLGTYLISLCKYYYELQSETGSIAHHIYQQKVLEEPIPELAIKTVYECSDCLTVYDETYGDIVNDILPGIDFKALPEKLFLSYLPCIKKQLYSH